MLALFFYFTTYQIPTNLHLQMFAALVKKRKITIEKIFFQKYIVFIKVFFVPSIKANCLPSGLTE